MRFNFPRSFRLRAAGAAVAILAIGIAWTPPAPAASDDGDISATVVRPIAIAAANALRFGSFSTATAGDTVTISTAGGRTFSGTALGVTSTVGQATFNVTGEGSLTYSITLPVGSVNITTDDGGSADEIIAVSNFLSDPATTGTLSGSLGAAGSETLNVGARLTTVASQRPGLYTGVFSVTVQYE